MFAMNTLRFLSPMTILLLLFYVVETAHRERSVHLDAIYFALPVRNGAILTGKLVAVLMVCMIIIVAVMMGGIMIISFQNVVPLQFLPFLIVWGGLLVPTCIVWCACVLAVYAFTGKRFLTYGICLAGASINDYLDESGKMSWVWNWPILTDLRWSDMGLFELDRTALLLNRAMIMGLAIFFLVAASLLMQRRTPDKPLGIARFRSRQTRLKFALLVSLLLIPISTGAILFQKTREGFEGSVLEKAAKDYWRHNLATYKDARLPDLDHVALKMEIKPHERFLSVNGTYSLSSQSDEPLTRIPLTTGFHWENVVWTLNGQPYEPENRSGLCVFTPEPPLTSDIPCEIGFQFEGTFPKGISKNGRGVSEYILPSGAVLTSFSPSFTPVIGFMEGIGIYEENRYQSRDYPDNFFTGVTEPLFGRRHPFTTEIQVTIPEEYTVNATGTLQQKHVENGSAVFHWSSDYPVRFFNIIAGKWDQKQGDGTRLFYHPEHTYNIDEILFALDASREFYSKWFMPFPWQELRISEFSGVSVYAQGFPTNISFSEGIGFLTKDNVRTNPAFTVTAHECAHQWWGNLVTPGDGPGGNILSEGMADFSTALLTRQIKGDRARMEFCKRGEESYTHRRQTDSERPLVKTDGSRPGDTVVMYDKGCWVFWMLFNLLGEESALAGMQTFIDCYKDGPDYPVLQDFQAVMREFAKDTNAYDRFIRQWFYEVVIPEYVILNASIAMFEAEEANESDIRGEPVCSVTVTVENKGSGSMPVCIAAARNPRYDGDGTDIRDDYMDARVTVDLEPGKVETIQIHCPFEPDRIVIDPDVMVLQMRRQLAQHHF
jgi:ABC-2 type transport system permease protein